jgi:hypothetical protein
MLLRHIPRILLGQPLPKPSNLLPNFSSISAEENKSVWVEDVSSARRREEVSESPITEPENLGNTGGRLARLQNHPC